MRRKKDEEVRGFGQSQGCHLRRNCSQLFTASDEKTDACQSVSASVFPLRRSPWPRSPLSFVRTVCSNSGLPRRAKTCFHVIGGASFGRASAYSLSASLSL